MSRIPVSFCICALLCFLAAPGCRQKAEDPPPPQPQETQHTEPPGDVTITSTDMEQAAVPGEPVETATHVESEPVAEPPVVTEPEGPAEFELEKISIFDLPREIREMFTDGQYQILTGKPEDQVKTYPGFESNKPMYGSILVDVEPDKTDSGIRYHFAIDESRGPDSGHDRLYFDSDCDGDLSDETALKPMSKVPDGARMLHYSNATYVDFDYLNVKPDPGNDSIHIEVMPRMLTLDSRQSYLSLVPTEARKGQISLGGRKYNTVLGCGPLTSRGFDHPSTMLCLGYARDRGFASSSWQSPQQLELMHWVGNGLYRFSATPEGDRLFVRPYDGPRGVFEMDAGGRNIEHMSITGCLQSKDITVPFSCGIGEDSGQDSKSSCRLPVGDYLLRYMIVTYGDLQVSLSQNYHSDGKPRGVRNRTLVYGIKIREDKPFMFDFSNEPAVLFASPAKRQRFSQGEILKVEAVLTDPALDLMISRLYDVTAGNEGKSLDPKLTIARADGEVVAEGTMPFG